jgi:hypothetical protein
MRGELRAIREKPALPKMPLEMRLRCVELIAILPLRRAAAIAKLLEELGPNWRVSGRSLRRWRLHYEIFGLDGLKRKRRVDAGLPRCGGAFLMAAIQDAAKRVQKVGDIAREYRSLRITRLMGYRSFAYWIRKERERAA